MSRCPRDALARDRLLVAPVNGPVPLLQQLTEAQVPVPPVYCGSLTGSPANREQIRVAIGEALPAPVAPAASRFLQGLAPGSQRRWRPADPSSAIGLRKSPCAPDCQRKASGSRRLGRRKRQVLKCARVSGGPLATPVICRWCRRAA